MKTWSFKQCITVIIMRGISVATRNSSSAEGVDASTAQTEGNRELITPFRKNFVLKPLLY
jgi:hypothetical protein